MKEFEPERIYDLYFDTVYKFVNYITKSYCSCQKCKLPSPAPRATPDCHITSICRILVSAFITPKQLCRLVIVHPELIEIPFVFLIATVHISGK